MDLLTPLQADLARNPKLEPLAQTLSIPLFLACQVDVFTPLQAVLAHAWVLWECVVLAQPLLVVGPQPGDCCSAAAALLALAAPLPYSADFRPYFTIHDAEFHAMSCGDLPGPASALPRLIAVTNLYFVKVRLYPVIQDTDPARQVLVSQERVS